MAPLILLIGILHERIAMSAGRRIREDRGKVKISLRQLAKDVGISPSYLSDIEKDRRKLNLNMTLKITAALYQYLGGDVHKRFDWLLISAGLYTSERGCLVRLWEISDSQYHKNATLYSLRSEIYEALYGELDRHINGVDSPNMFEMGIMTDSNSWENQ